MAKSPPRPIRPLDRPLQLSIAVPGSKSITNRALILAALYCQHATLNNALACDDTAVMAEALNTLGWRVERIKPNTLEIISSARKPPRTLALNLRDSGTSMRFLTALCATRPGRFMLDGSPRMRQRPIGELIEALQHLQVPCDSAAGYPPVTIDGGRLAGHSVRIRADRSSQFASALMMIAPSLLQGLTIELEGEPVSRPYLEMTYRMMQTWGLHCQADGQRFVFDPTSGIIKEFDYSIEPDATAASYWFAAAAIAGGQVRVLGVKPDMLQGDARFVHLLERMGCRVQTDADGTTVAFDPRCETLRGIEANLNEISDTVPTLAAVACFASTPTIIRGVSHMRLKESDRIAALAAELRKLRVDITEHSDGLAITPGPMTGTRLETFNDHRLAMAFAMIGLKLPGVMIDNPACVAKTYPDFWTDLERLYMCSST